MTITHCIVPRNGRVSSSFKLWDLVEFAGQVTFTTDRFPQWAILRMFAHVPEHPAPTSHILHPRILGFHNLHVHRKNPEENVFRGWIVF